MPSKKKPKSNVERSSGCEAGAPLSCVDRRASATRRLASPRIHEDIRLSIVEMAHTSCTEHLRKTIWEGAKGGGVVGGTDRGAGATRMECVVVVSAP